MPRYRDLTGLKINKITFLEYVENDRRRNAMWKVRCDCGTEFLVRANAVRTGNTRSCGCIRTDKTQ